MAVALRSNDFGHFRVEKGERQAWVLRARCLECKETDDLPLGGGKSTLTQDYAERGFRNRHWVLGKNRDADRCPKCIDAEIASRKAAQIKSLAKLAGLDLIPTIPEETMPRQRLNRPIDWLPTPEEVAEFLKNGQKAIGGDPKTRREMLLWYPAITRGAENFIRSVIETRISKKMSGLFTYDGEWDDTRVAEAVGRIYPAAHANRDMIRMVRMQFFGPASTRISRAASPPIARALPLPVGPDQSPKSKPAPTPRAMAASAPEKRPSDDVRFDRMETDLIHMLEEVEKLKANRGWNAVMERIEKIEAIQRGEKSSVKPIEDYTITELLAEIGRRTSPAEDANVVMFKDR